LGAYRSAIAAPINPPIKRAPPIFVVLSFIITSLCIF
jgi:hypothetical protein